MSGDRTATVESESPTHLAVLVGSPSTWSEHGAALDRAVDEWAACAAPAGVRWLTVRPVGGADVPAGSPGAPRHVRTVDQCCVIVDPCADGRARLAAVLDMPGPLRDDLVSARLNDPAPGDPDLIIVAGSPTALPAAVVWELAYAELVFVDDGRWPTVDDIESALREYARRHRRFGGL